MLTNVMILDDEGVITDPHKIAAIFEADQYATDNFRQETNAQILDVMQVSTLSISQTENFQ